MVFVHRPGKPPLAVAAVAPSLAQPEICQALVSLVRKDLVTLRQSSSFAGAVEYAFKHELLRNAAYDSLIKKSRRKCHARAAAWFIHQGGERIGEFTGLVAAHFEQADRCAEASDWYGRAGHQALAGHAPALAGDYFRK